MKDPVRIPTPVVAVEVVAAHHRLLQLRATPWSITIPDPTRRRPIDPVPVHHRIAAARTQPAQTGPVPDRAIRVNRDPPHDRRLARNDHAPVRPGLVPDRKAQPGHSAPEDRGPVRRLQPAVQNPGPGAERQQTDPEAEARHGLEVDHAPDQPLRPNLKQAANLVPDPVNPDRVRLRKPSHKDPSPDLVPHRPKAAEAGPVPPTRKWEKSESVR